MAYNRYDHADQKKIKCASITSNLCLVLHNFKASFVIIYNNPPPPKKKDDHSYPSLSKKLKQK